MDVAVSASPGLGSAPKRAALFGLVVAAGALLGIGWNGALAAQLYVGLLGIAFDPRAEIAGLAAGVGLGFVLGLIHVVHV